jgi:hypothetical protein
VIVVMVIISLVLYALGAVALGGWWLSGAVALAVAALLWRRHPQARFSAYVFCTVLALRGALSRTWPLVLFAAAVVALMQTRAARQAWPRLVAGRVRNRAPKADDRMRGS